VEKEKKLTPLMRQYHDIKATLPDALLLFQVGDFYELFFDDAKKASAFLGITLTKRGHIEGEPIPLCGVPLHAINYYLSKLVKGGFKVAICDQIEEPKPGKVVDRKVIQVLTPGTLTDSNLLDEKSASYLFSFFPIHNSWGLLFAELLTGQIFATVLPSDSTKTLEAELIRFYPDEILIPDNKIGRSFGSFLKKMGYFITLEKYEEIDIYPWLDKNFNSDVIKQINSNDALKAAIINFYCYIKKTQEGALDNFKNLFFYKTDDFLILDSSTQRNLELVQNCQDGSRKNSLFELLDYAKTSMGSRMIKKWILRPLIKKEIILQRQDVIEYFVKNISILNDLENKFENIGDLERIVGRIALNKANLNDYLALLKAFEYLPSIIELLSIKELHLILLIRSMLGDFSSLENLLRNSLNDNSSKDWFIKKCFDLELYRLRDLVENSNQKIIEL
jgi:DNA mismatch repair protein MutS